MQEVQVQEGQVLRHLLQRLLLHAEAVLRPHVLRAQLLLRVQVEVQVEVPVLRVEVQVEESEVVG